MNRMRAEWLHKIERNPIIILGAATTLLFLILIFGIASMQVEISDLRKEIRTADKKINNMKMTFDRVTGITPVEGE